MTTQAAGSHQVHSPSHGASTAKEVTRYLVPLGRALFAGIFVMSAPVHFTQMAVGYAAQQGVPLAGILVPFSGILALLGGLGILFGYRARWSAWLLVAFLVPVTLMMHQFWKIDDPMMARMQQAMFLKNLSMLGGALLIAHFGAGPISLDARRRAS